MERKAIRILGLGGSLKAGSGSLSALKTVLAAAAAAGAETELLALHESGLPFFDPAKELKDYPVAVPAFLDAARRADGIVWCSPAYHGTVSGAIKNALDFLEFLSKDPVPYITDKPVALISVSGGAQAAVNTVNALAHVAQALRGIVVPMQAPIVTTGQTFDKEGRFSDAKMHARLELMGAELVKLAQKLKA